MSFQNPNGDYDDFHPIDLVENFEKLQNMDFARIDDDQITIVIKGKWHDYSITLAWSRCDETLRMILTYEEDIPEDRLPAKYDMLNLVNDQCWAGAFTYWKQEKLTVYRYGLILAGGQIANSEQIDTMISGAVLSAEKYYPAFMLCVWDGKTPQQAIKIAMDKTYGRA